MKKFIAYATEKGTFYFTSHKKAHSYLDKNRTIIKNAIGKGVRYKDVTTLKRLEPGVYK